MTARSLSKLFTVIPSVPRIWGLSSKYNEIYIFFPYILSSSIMKTYTEFYIVQICFIHMQKEKQCGVMQSSYTSYYIAFVANVEYCSIKYPLNIWLNFAIILSPRVGNGNPFQYSYLENSMDRETWWATVHGVAKSQTWLSTHTHTHTHITKSAINRNILQVCALQVYLSGFSISSTMYDKTTIIKGAKKVIVKDTKEYLCMVYEVYA